jgi:4'-phosphopantetheinyl transferase
MMNLINPSWSGPSDHAQLESREIHVWGSSIDRDQAWSSRFAKLLSKSERERASRFRFELDARRFIASRAILRLILSRYLEVDPCKLEFSYGPHGKPALLKEDFRFSLSHSEALLLCAVSRDVELGLDIERIRQTIDADPIADRTFSPDLSARIQSLSGLAKVEAFYSNWVLHEAFVKAIGAGLASASSEFQNFLPDTKHDGYQFTVEGDYVSALVALAATTSLTHFWWID